MWRRVPSALRLVAAAFIAMPTSSTKRRGSTPDVHGLLAIRAQVSAHCESHSRSCASERLDDEHALGCRIVGGGGLAHHEGHCGQGREEAQQA
jgi:hypothetical protein